METEKRQTIIMEAALTSLAKNLVIRGYELVLVLTKMGYRLSVLGGHPFLDAGISPTDEYDLVKKIAESNILRAGYRGQ